MLFYKDRAKNFLKALSLEVLPKGESLQNHVSDHVSANLYPKSPITPLKM